MSKALSNGNPISAVLDGKLSTNEWWVCMCVPYVHVPSMCVWVLPSPAEAILIIRRDSREGNYSTWNSGNKATADPKIFNTNEAIALTESMQAHILFSHLTET